MLLRVKNWKLAFLALIIIAFLMRLGFWQLSRADQKTHMLNTYHARTVSAPLNPAVLNQAGDWQYYRTTLAGQFDNQHTFLLDNKIFKGQVGYEVFTPFLAAGITQPILVDRGFVPLTASRDKLPAIRDITGTQAITGMVNQPPGYVKYGPIKPDKTESWPMRIEYINLQEISPLMNTSLYRYIINLTPDDPSAYPIEWQIVALSPERHMGYAVQWFALALTLLILSVALNRSP